MENEVKQLIIEFEQKLASNDAEIITDLKKLLVALDNLPEKSQKDSIMQIASMIESFAYEAYNGTFYYELVYMNRYARLVFFHFPYNEKAAIVLLHTTRGLLELKINREDKDNMEIYQKDIEFIWEHFQTNTEIAYKCMACFALLQVSCLSQDRNITSFPIYFVERNVDNMEAISSRFPNDESINKLYNRSLSDISYELRNHPNKDISNKFIHLLINQIITRNIGILTP